MERLTIRNSDGSVSQPTTTTFEAVMYRLAAYEDTGLTPERVAELAQAERDGRLVVLTCKVGDTVFCVVNGCLCPEAECPEGSSSCDTCRENKKTVIENKLDCVESVVIASEHWGETVFATLQEAEAAERREVEHR